MVKLPIPKFRSHGERAAWVKYRLDLAGTSQSELAREAGCAVQYVNAVLRGRRPGRRIKKLIASRLGADYLELWDESMKEVA